MAGFQFQKLQTSIEYDFFSDFSESGSILFIYFALVLGNNILVSGSSAA